MILSAKMRRIKSGGGAGGFTLIETIVAIAILALAITGPLVLAERGLAASRTAGQEVTAFYLAQEAFEFVKNERDKNMLTGSGGGQSWLAGLNPCIVTTDETDLSGGCGIDATAQPPGQQIVNCSNSNSDCALSRHKGDAPNEALKGIYGYPNGRGDPESNWEKTQFRRKVFIRGIAGTNDEVKVQVVVFWGDSGEERTFIGSGNMLNWYDAK